MVGELVSTCLPYVGQFLVYTFLFKFPSSSIAQIRNKLDQALEISQLDSFQMDQHSSGLQHTSHGRSVTRIPTTEQRGT
jgi:hypothetical protein